MASVGPLFRTLTRLQSRGMAGLQYHLKDQPGKEPHMVIGRIQFLEDCWIKSLRVLLAVAWR